MAKKVILRYGKKKIKVKEDWCIRIDGIPVDADWKVKKILLTESVSHRCQRCGPTFTLRMRLNWNRKYLNDVNYRGSMVSRYLWYYEEVFNGIIYKVAHSRQTAEFLSEEHGGGWCAWNCGPDEVGSQLKRARNPKKVLALFESLPNPKNGKVSHWTMLFHDGTINHTFIVDIDVWHEEVNNQTASFIRDIGWDINNVTVRYLEMNNEVGLKKICLCFSFGFLVYLGEKLKVLGDDGMKWLNFKNVNGLLNNYCSGIFG